MRSIKRSINSKSSQIRGYNSRMRILSGLALLALATPARAQTLVIKSVPATAAIYRIRPGDSTLVPLGTGTAEFKLLDKDPNKVVVRLEGYRDSTASWEK